MENKSYVVYIHRCPNNKVYIGITCREPKKRWGNGKAYVENNYFNNAINKYGWENIEHKIISTNLSKEEAEELEIYLINEKYKSNKRENGYNIEYGGCHQGKTSEETRKKQSIIAKGQHRSPKTEFKKGRTSIVTNEMKEKISKANKGKHACVRTEFKKGHKPLNAKRIMCIETQIIYNSIKEASIKTKINDGHICYACKGIRKSAGGYHWKYI